MKYLPLLLLFLLLCHHQSCEATKGHGSFRLKGNLITEIEEFGYMEGGTLSFSAQTSPPSPNITLSLCTSKEYDMLIADAQDEYSLCYGTSGYCEITDHLLNEPFNGYLVKSTNLYYLILIKCGSDQVVDVDISYLFLNPGGAQLSLGFIPLPSLYISLTMIWLFLILVCCFDWLINKNHLVISHGLLALVIGLKLAVVCVALCYWKVAENTGTYIIQLKYLEGFLFAIAETSFFCVLLLVAKGWRITRNALPPVEIRAISAALVLLLSTLLFFSFYKDEYHFLSLMIMYFFMLPKIFTSITRNTRMLQTQILLLRYANTQLDANPLLAKVKMFVMLRTAVILHLGSILMVSSMRIIMSWSHLWVNDCVGETASLVMISAICYLLRPREYGAFSPRSYLNQNPFPVLSMQNLDHDHFDDYFVDQLWDPELVLMNANAFNNAGINPFDGSCQFDSNTTLVIEYPSPPPKEDGKVPYYPKLALALLEKPIQKRTSPSSTSEDSGSSSTENVQNVNISSNSAVLPMTDNNV